MSTQSEIRKDYLEDRYVIIAPQRDHRPHDILPANEVGNKITKPCVFCSTDETNEVITTIPDENPQQPWSIKVIKNRFPVVSPENDQAYGYQEVVIETPNHNQDIADLSVDHVTEIINLYGQRTQILEQDKKIAYILVFRNSGDTAGASLHHAHSQIFASQFIPPHIQSKSQLAQAYQKEHGSCVYCDTINKERNTTRHISEDEYAIAFCPWASQYNYEAWILPKRHVDNLASLTDDERRSLAIALQQILKKLRQKRLSYNYYIHQLVTDPNQHVYIKITPRAAIWGGLEVSSGLIINSVAPEAAATFYRQADHPG